MKKIWVLSLIFSLVVCINVSTFALPFVKGQIDGNPFDLTSNIQSIPGIGYMLPTTLVSQPGADINISAVMSPETRVISYVFDITDIGNASTVDITFGLPIVPINTPNVVEVDLYGYLKDQSSGDGATITPIGGWLHISQLSKDGGVNSINTGVNVGPGMTGSGLSAPAKYDYGPFKTTKLGPVGSWDFLETQVAFTISGNDDQASLTGTTVVSGVPEPNTFILFGSCLIALGLISRVWGRKRSMENKGKL